MDALRLAAATLGLCLLQTSRGVAMDSEAGYGDAEYGRGLAVRWCSSCHLITADQKGAKADAPPFSTIAQLPNFNADRLAHLMLSPHPNMAKLSLSRSAVDDLAAYILSLKK